MEDQKVIKCLFKVDAISTIEDTEDEKEGEASIGYKYHLDTSLPELAYGLAGFLKAIDTDEDIKKTVDAITTVGEAFIALLQLYYTKAKGE